MGSYTILEVTEFLNRKYNEYQNLRLEIKFIMMDYEEYEKDEIDGYIKYFYENGNIGETTLKDLLEENARMKGE